MLGILSFVQSANTMQISSGWVLLYAVAAMMGVVLGIRTGNHNLNSYAHEKEKGEVEGKGGKSNGKGGRKRSNGNASTNGGNKSHNNSAYSSSTAVTVTPTRRKSRNIPLDQAMDYYNDNEVNIMEIPPIRPDTPLKVVFEKDDVEEYNGYGYKVAKDIISSIGIFFSSLSKDSRKKNNGHLMDVPLPKFKEIPAPLSLDTPNEDLLLPHDNGRKNGRPLSSIIRADISIHSSGFPSPMSSRGSPTSPPLTPSHTYRRCSERISERGGRRKGYWRDLDFYGNTGSDDMDSDEGDY